MTSLELLVLYVVAAAIGTILLAIIGVFINRFCIDEDFRAATIGFSTLAAWVIGIGVGLWAVHPLSLAKLSYFFTTYWPHLWLAIAVPLAGYFILRDASHRAFIWTLTKLTVCYLSVIVLLMLTYFSVAQLLTKYGVIN